MSLEDLIATLSTSRLESDCHARSDALAFLRATSDPWGQNGECEHFTCSALVTSRRGVLIHKHKKSGDWVGPGGHANLGELAHEVAIREVFEETGIIARCPPSGPRLLQIDVFTTTEGHRHFDLCFALDAESTTISPARGESGDVLWLESEQATALVAPNFARAISKVSRTKRRGSFHRHFQK